MQRTQRFAENLPIMIYRSLNHSDRFSSCLYKRVEMFHRIRRKNCSPVSRHTRAGTPSISINLPSYSNVKATFVTRTVSFIFRPFPLLCEPLRFSASLRWVSKIQRRGAAHADLRREYMFPLLFSAILCVLCVSALALTISRADLFCNTKPQQHKEERAQQQQIAQISGTLRSARPAA